MMDIKVPGTVKRGEVLKGIVEVSDDELGSARRLEVVLYNILKFGKEKDNFSAWEIKKIFSPKDAKSLFELPFEFAIDEGAPVTYRGKELSSKWKVAVRVNVKAALDRKKEREIVVMR